jgi:ribonuclease VapC
MIHDDDLVAILRREAEADACLPVVAPSAGILRSSVGFLETSMVLAGRTGGQTAWSELDALIDEAAIEIVPRNPAQASAARLAFLRYGKGRHRAGLDLGDGASYAFAKRRDLRMLFNGDDFPHTDRTAALEQR